MRHDSEKLTLSVMEAAKALGISRNLAYDKVRARNLPVIKLGKRWLVPKRALERMLMIENSNPSQTGK